MTDGKPLHVIGVSPSWDHWKSILHISKQLIFDCVCHLCNIWGEKKYPVAFKSMQSVSHLCRRQFKSREKWAGRVRGEKRRVGRRSAEVRHLGCHPYPALSKGRAQGEAMAGGSSTAGIHCSSRLSFRSLGETVWKDLFLPITFIFTTAERSTKYNQFHFVDTGSEYLVFCDRGAGERI